MPIRNLESIMAKAVALKPVLDNLPRPSERVVEVVMFVDDYNIMSGSEGTPMGENCFRATIIGGFVKKGRQFEDMADYWDFVIGILADRTQSPGRKVNAMFCFQYAFTIHYLNQDRSEEMVNIYAALNSLIEEAMANCPRDPLYIVYPRTERELSSDVKNYNCLTLTDRIFRDSKAVNQIRREFWPHGQEGMYKMNICGGVILKPTRV
jgi:hypothetical protein